MKDQTIHDTGKRHRDLERAVQDEVGRCLIHIETGLFAERREPLHARFCQLISIMIVENECATIGLEMRPEGLTMLINPDYFLNTLQQHCCIC